MAAITEHVEFPSLLIGVELLSFQEADLPGNVVATYSSRTVSIIKLDDRKTIHSWNIRHGHRLTSPCVWCEETEKFTTAINNQEILAWPKDETSLEKVKRKRLKCGVHTVFCLNKLEPLVLCADGTVNFLSKAEARQGASHVPQWKKIRWCHALCVADVPCVLHLVERQNGKLLLVFSHYRPDGTWTQSSKEVPKSGGSLLNCCCSAGFDHVNIYFLWTNGDLCWMTVSTNGHFSNHEKIQTLMGVQINSAMTMVDSSHIAVACLEKEGEVGIGMFDIKFKALQAWKQYPTKINKKVQLFCVCGHLITTSHDKIYACQYECQPSTLASILGQRKVFSTQESSLVETSHFSWHVESQKAEEKRPEPDMKKLFTKLADPALTPSYSDFKNTLLQVETKCIGPSCVSSLFDTLISHSEISTLHVSLNTILDVPETCICKSLQFFLMTTEEELKKQIAIKATKTSIPKDVTKMSPFGPTKAYIINLIMLLPYNDVFLLECIKSVHFGNILSLLGHLCHLLCVMTLNIPITDKKLTVLKVIDWIGLVIDGHMTQLVLSSDARKIILKLHQIVEEQTALAKDFVSLEAVLQQLKKQCAKIPKRQMTGQYCIEVLHVY
ncbi:hypothetical protein ScPMuIL_004890 [Solemya velum]